MTRVFQARKTLAEIQSLLICPVNTRKGGVRKLCGFADAARRMGYVGVNRCSCEHVVLEASRGVGDSRGRFWVEATDCVIAWNKLCLPTDVGDRCLRVCACGDGREKGDVLAKKPKQADNHEQHSTHSYDVNPDYRTYDFELCYDPSKRQIL